VPIRRPLAHNGTLSASANSMIVWQTLIFPLEVRTPTSEPDASLCKSSSTHYCRSTSAMSMHSNRPHRERVHMPQPPRSPTSRHKSSVPSLEMQVKSLQEEHNTFDESVTTILMPRWKGRLRPSVVLTMPSPNNYQSHLPVCRT
jgi:hypothetical protein